MQPDSQLIAEFLVLVALMAASIEYCEVMQRRKCRRLEAAASDRAGKEGLLGLVRVFAAD